MSVTLAGIVCNHVAFLIALIGIHRLALRHTSRSGALLAVWLTALGPLSFVFSMLYPSALFLAASVWAPITEELLFRGALFSHLRERFRPIISGIVVGLIFALVHPQGWPLVPVLGTIGFNFAMIRQWRGSIIPCVTAHSIHNTLTLIFALSVLR